MEAIISGILGVLIGGFIGHRLALGRDKRTEYNSVIRPLKQKLLKHIDALKEHQTNFNISHDDILSIRCWVTDKEFSSISLAYKDYCDLYREYIKTNKYGVEFYTEEERDKILIQAIKISNYLHIK